MPSVSLRVPKFLVERYKNTEKTVEREVRNVLVNILQKVKDDKDFHRLLESYRNVTLHIYLPDKAYILLKKLKDKYGYSYSELIRLMLFYWYSAKY